MPMKLVTSVGDGQLNGTTILSAVKKVVDPKTEVMSMKCVVVLMSGRPVVNEPYIHTIDALMAPWLPGTEGQGVNDVLFGDYGFTGRLVQTWLHVWGNFCLCFEHMKLLHDRDPITCFGIKNGDQGKEHRDLHLALNKGSSSIWDLCGDMNNKQNHVINEEPVTCF
nr:beta-glucosidase BoGH3B-like [Tanacetum cinerariifolium]